MSDQSRSGPKPCEWQPIATAPNGGTFLAGGWSYDGIDHPFVWDVTAAWREGSGFACDVDLNGDIMAPTIDHITHWMPFPAPPFGAAPPSRKSLDHEHQPMKDLPMLKTIDQHYSDLCDSAQEQAEALGNQFAAILDGEDEDGEEYAMRLCGVRTETNGRRAMVFMDPAAPHARQVVYVDNILALADLIRREVVVGND